MIPGTSMEPLAQRLYRELAARLADRLGCCPIHGTRLICCQCDVTWTASASEKVEVEALVQRTALYDLQWPTWPCGRCDTQDAAMCPDCYEPVADQAFVGLTPAEEARLNALLSKHMRLTCLPDPGVADDLTGAHEGGKSP